jgi:hypothetical protein
MTCTIGNWSVEPVLTRVGNQHRRAATPKKSDFAEISPSQSHHLVLFQRRNSFADHPLIAHLLRSILDSGTFRQFGFQRSLNINSAALCMTSPEGTLTIDDTEQAGTVQHCSEPPGDAALNRCSAMRHLPEFV